MRIEPNPAAVVPLPTPPNRKQAVELLIGADTVSDIDASAVKTVLVDRLSVSPGVDTRSLEPQVPLVLAARNEVDERRTLTALPEFIPALVQQFLGDFDRNVLLLIVRQNVVCLQSANAEAAEIRKITTNANFQIVELQGQLADRDARIKPFCEQKTVMENENGDLKVYICTLKTDLETMNRDAGLIGRVRSELADPDTREEPRGILAELVGDGVGDKPGAPSPAER